MAFKCHEFYCNNTFLVCRSFVQTNLCIQTHPIITHGTFSKTKRNVFSLLKYTTPKLATNTFLTIKNYFPKFFPSNYVVKAKTIFTNSPSVQALYLSLTQFILKDNVIHYIR
jgi:hypothetical protein